MSVVAGRRRWILLLLFAAAFLIPTLTYRSTTKHEETHVWDASTASEPPVIIPHYYAEGIVFDEELCALHGWSSRDESEEPEMWDAILLEDERDLDMLEIRMNELDFVVNKYLIVESNRSLSGEPKRLAFAENYERFKHWRIKTAYLPLHEPVLSPWRRKNFPQATSRDALENSHRAVLTRLVRSRLPNAARAPLVLFSTVPEIPAAQTLQLLKACRFPGPLHLQLREYLYSFEWTAGWGSWRAQVHEWDEAAVPGAPATPTVWGHELAGERMLADSGWHCRECYGQTGHYTARAKEMINTKELGGSLPSTKKIQDALCSGTDIFNVLSEHSFSMFRSKIAEKSQSVVNLPRSLYQKLDDFRYLLPGGCRRRA